MLCRNLGPRPCFDVGSLQSCARHGAPRSQVSVTPRPFPLPLWLRHKEPRIKPHRVAPVAGVALPTPGPHEGSHVREGAASEWGGGSLGAAIQKRIWERGGRGWRPEC